MTEARFPSDKYSHQIVQETRELLSNDNKELKGSVEELTVTSTGRPEPAEDSVILTESSNADDEEVTLFLQMNADERWADEDSFVRHGTRPNYQIFDGRPEECDPIYERERIDDARNKWFGLVSEKLVDTSSGENTQLGLTPNTLTVDTVYTMYGRCTFSVA